MNKALLAYFESVPEFRRSRLTALHGLITTLFPEAVVGMGYRMPTYRAGEGWVAIANQKNYVSLYTCSASHITAFRDKHPRFKTGKGCINFRDSDDLPLQDLTEVIVHAIRHPKGR